MSRCNAPHKGIHFVSDKGTNITFYLCVCLFVCVHVQINESSDDCLLRSVRSQYPQGQFIGVGETWLIIGDL